MANIYDIAKLAGVSKTTVSKVLNNQYGVNPDTRELVLKAVKELNYTPNQAARRLATNRSGVLGVIYDSFETPIYIHLANLLEKYAAGQGYHLVFCNCNDNPQAKSKYVDYFMGGTADGLIFFGSDTQDRVHIKRLKESRFPFVVIENYFEDMEINNILIDNVGGARLAVNHLIELGHSRIAHITGNISHRAASDRLNGYMQALQEHGLRFNPEYVIYTNAKSKQGTIAAEKLLELEERPTAFFAFNDVLAYEAIHHLLNLGYKVPQDFSVVSFDNSANILTFFPGSISLTSIAQPMDNVAQAAISLINDSILDKNSLPRQLKFETSLFEGSSCARYEAST